MAQLLTEPIALAIIEAVSHGVPVETAARAAGVGREAFYRLIERSRDPSSGMTDETRSWAINLAERLDAARAAWEAERVAAIQAIATNTDHKDTFRASTWLLNNHPSTRQTWREERRSVVEHLADPTIAQVHTIVRELPQHDLLALGSTLLGDDSQESDEVVVDAREATGAGPNDGV